MFVINKKHTPVVFQIAYITFGITYLQSGNQHITTTLDHPNRKPSFRAVAACFERCRKECSPVGTHADARTFCQIFRCLDRKWPELLSRTKRVVTMFHKCMGCDHARIADTKLTATVLWGLPCLQSLQLQLFSYCVLRHDGLLSHICSSCSEKSRLAECLNKHSPEGFSEQTINNEVCGAVQYN